MSKNSKFQSDKFKKARGGFSRWLQVFCESCIAPIVIYQKDGPGILKRMYLDRMVNVDTHKWLKSNLECPKCKTLLGVPIIYKKEDRPAIRLFAGAVGKKIISSKEL